MMGNALHRQCPKSNEFHALNDVNLGKYVNHVCQVEYVPHCPISSFQTPEGTGNLILLYDKFICLMCEVCFYKIVTSCHHVVRYQ